MLRKTAAARRSFACVLALATPPVGIDSDSALPRATVPPPVRPEPAPVVIVIELLSSEAEGMVPTDSATPVADEVATRPPEAVMARGA